MTSPYDSKRNMVTGAAGFLGSRLCERLVDQRHEALGIDHYFTGRRANAAHLLGKMIDYFRPLVNERQST